MSKVPMNLEERVAKLEKEVAWLRKALEKHLQHHGSPITPREPRPPGPSRPDLPDGGFPREI